MRQSKIKTFDFVYIQNMYLSRLFQLHTYMHTHSTHQMPTALSFKICVYVCVYTSRAHVNHWIGRWQNSHFNYVWNALGFVVDIYWYFVRASVQLFWFFKLYTVAWHPAIIACWWKMFAGETEDVVECWIQELNFQMLIMTENRRSEECNFWFWAYLLFFHFDYILTMENCELQVLGNNIIEFIPGQREKWINKWWESMIWEEIHLFCCQHFLTPFINVLFISRYFLFTFIRGHWWQSPRAAENRKNILSLFIFDFVIPKVVERQYWGQYIFML